MDFDTEVANNAMDSTNPIDELSVSITFICMCLLIHIYYLVACADLLVSHVFTESTTKRSSHDINHIISNTILIRFELNERHVRSSFS